MVINFNSLLFISFYLIPPLLHRHAGASSFAAGFVIVSTLCVVWAFIAGKRISVRSLFVSGMIFCIMLIVSIFAIFFNPYADPEKSLATVVLVPLCMLSASTLMPQVTRSAINATLYIIISIQLLSAILGFRSDSLIFNEPSHFGIYTMPLMINFMLTEERVGSILIVMASYFICMIVFFSSIVFVSFVISGVLISTRSNMKWYVYAIPILIATIGVFVYLQNSSYINSRLQFSDTDNATALTLLSGYQRLTNIIGDGYFLGVGVQNFGSYPVESDAYYKLLLVDGRSNTNDGGVSVAKIGSELGVFSIIIPIMCVQSIFHYLRAKDGWSSIGVAYAISILCEFFIRGVGYFSPTMIIGMSVILLNRRNLAG